MHTRIYDACVRVCQVLDVLLVSFWRLKSGHLFVERFPHMTNSVQGAALVFAGDLLSQSFVKWTKVCDGVCMYVYIHTCMHTYMRMHASKHAYTHTHTHTHTIHTHTYIYTTYMHAYTHTCMHTYVYDQGGARDEAGLEAARQGLNGWRHQRRCVMLLSCDARW